MSEWGDYAITAVRYNNDETRIEQVKRKYVKPKNLTNTKTVSRSSIVSSIGSGNEYTTAIKNDNGKWSLGDPVHVLEVNGKKFIRTDQSDTKEDNLGGLPIF